MKKVHTLIFSYLILVVSTSFGQNSILQISESYGPHSIGFKAYHTFDKSRSFAMDTASQSTDVEKTIFRPMQVCIWYPAKSSANDPMLYKDYFFLKAHESGEVILTDSKKKAVIEEFLETDPVDPKILEMELSASMKAIKNASFDPENKFPVIIYGPSWWSTAFENALLFEFLASHGYIVVSSPSMGPDTREMPISRIGVETQARDMEFLLSQLDQISNADIDKIAVAGFSLGGLSNVLMQARNTSVDAWIGIDPSVHEAYEFFKESPYENYGRFTKPSLFINSAGYMNDLPFYDKLVYSDAFMVNLPQLEHTDLASLFIKLYAPRDKEGLHIRSRGYNLTAKYLLGFLNGVFKEGLDYEAFLQKVLIADQKDSSFVDFKSKKGIPAVEVLFEMFQNEKGNGLIEYLGLITGTEDNISYPESDLQKLIFLASENRFEELARELMRWYEIHYSNSFHSKVLKHRSFDQMLDMFLAVYQKNKSCHFSYEELNHTAHVLSMSGEGEKAIDYFNLNTQLYPAEARAYFNLGLGYYRISDKAKAESNFKKCLELQPDERYKNLALDFLKKLN